MFSGCRKKGDGARTAVEALGLEAEGAFHRAIEDARYTAKVLQQLPFEALKVYRSLDYYHLPANEDEELYIDFPDYAKYVSRIFPDRDSAIHDKTVTDMLCFRCHRMLKKKAALVFGEPAQLLLHCRLSGTRFAPRKA